MLLALGMGQGVAGPSVQGQTVGQAGRGQGCDPDGSGSRATTGIVGPRLRPSLP
jgi:hypothetical protein